MKHLLLSLLALGLLFGSCSKESRTNKQLDGTWLVVKINEQALPDGRSQSFSFSPAEKGEGSITISLLSSSTGLQTYTGTYTIEDDIIAVVVPSFNADAYSILELDNEKLKLRTMLDETLELEKQ